MHRFAISLAAVVILLLAPFVALPRPLVLAQEATPVVEWERGVTYGEANGSPLQLDVFQPPARDKPRPVVILLPGWGATRLGMAQQAQELAAAGYVAVTVDYTLTWPEFIDDAQLAVRWVRANADRYEIDPERAKTAGIANVTATCLELLGFVPPDDLEPSLLRFRWTAAPKP